MDKRMFMSLLLFSSLLSQSNLFYPHYNNYIIPELSKEELDRLVQKRLKDREESCKKNKLSKKLRMKLGVK